MFLYCTVYCTILYNVLYHILYYALFVGVYAILPDMTCTVDLGALYCALSIVMCSSQDTVLSISQYIEYTNVWNSLMLGVPWVTSSCVGLNSVTYV